MNWKPATFTVNSPLNSAEQAVALLFFKKNCCLHESKGLRLFTERLRKETCNFALWGRRSPSNPALQDSRLVEEKPAERKWVEKEAENCLDLNKSPWTCQVCRSQIKGWGAELEGLAWKATWRRKVKWGKATGCRKQGEQARELTEQLMWCSFEAGKKV